jgi:periplasmic divalent cation tolerance protein
MNHVTEQTLAKRQIYKYSLEGITRSRLCRYMTISKQLKKKKANEGVIIISTFPNRSILSSASKRLILEKHLCACINVIKIHSFYLWKGKLENHDEYLALFKSTRKNIPALRDEIEKIHPYEVPEIVELKTNKFSKSYLSWLNNTTSKAAQVPSKKIISKQPLAKNKI